MDPKGVNGGAGAAPKEEALSSSGRKLVYFAAERTLMSWVRTALAIMAFGFVLDRFDVFVRRVGIGSATAPTSGGRDWVGAPIVLVGAVMAAVAAARYIGFARRYHRENSTEPGHGLLVASLFAVVVAVLGGAVVLFLWTVGRGP